jgi:hypothetical protein
MLSFRQYITEIFQPSSETEEKPARHLDYQGLDDEGQHIYQGEIKGGHIVESVFSIGKIGQYPRAVEMEFSVNGSTRSHGLIPDIAHEALRKAHSHIDHYIRTYRPDAIFYDTSDPVRHHIYQMGARRYGIPAFNYTNINSRGGIPD